VRPAFEELDVLSLNGPSLIGPSLIGPVGRSTRLVSVFGSGLLCRFGHAVQNCELHIRWGRCGCRRRLSHRPVEGFEAGSRV